MSNNLKWKPSEVVSTGLKLFIFMTAICLLLFSVNLLTSEIIENQKMSKISDAIDSIMGDEVSFEIEDVGSDDVIKAVYRITTIGEETVTDKGYCIQSECKGYGGTISLLIGINDSGRICGIKVIDDSETVSIGKKALASTDKLIDKFKGLSDSATIGQDINVVTGATVTSTAVINCVNTTIEFYNSVLKEAVENEQ